MALRIITLLFFFFTSLELLFGQTELEVMQQQLVEIKKKETEIANQIEELKLKASIVKLNQIGIPISKNTLDIAEHSAMILGFDCDSDKAKQWYSKAADEGYEDAINALKRLSWDNMEYNENVNYVRYCFKIDIILDWFKLGFKLLQLCYYLST